MKGVTFEQAFKYPFNRATCLWNGFWLLVPIFGWLALFGYQIRIHKEFIEGKFKKAPKMKFWKDFEFGLLMFVRMIPITLFMIFLFMVTIDSLTLFSAFVLFLITGVPVLLMNFFNKETISSTFEFKIIKGVFNNIGNYLIAYIYTMVLGFIFSILGIILVGIPANIFTKHIFFADFYRQHCKKL